MAIRPAEYPDDFNPFHSVPFTANNTVSQILLFVADRDMRLDQVLAIFESTGGTTPLSFLHLRALPPGVAFASAAIGTSFVGRLLTNGGLQVQGTGHATAAIPHEVPLQKNLVNGPSAGCWVREGERVVAFFSAASDPFDGAATIAAPASNQPVNLVLTIRKRTVIE